MSDTVVVIGTPVTCRVSFRDKAGALANPTTKSAVLTKPDSTDVPFADGVFVSVTSPGIWDLDVPSANLDLDGIYWIKIVGTGLVAVAIQDWFTVEPLKG